MGYERATLKAVSRALTGVGIVILEMQIHSSIKKLQLDGRRLSIICISLGWVDKYAYKVFGAIEVEPAML